jgi:hypothetical protein
MCPAHDDQNPSLSVNQGHTAVVLRCWAGCDPAEVLAAIGLRYTDLYDDDPDRWKSTYDDWKTRI